MKRLISVIGSAMGVFALIALMVFAFSMVKPGNSPLVPQISEQQVYPQPEISMQTDLPPQGTDAPYPSPVLLAQEGEDPYPPPAAYDETAYPPYLEIFKSDVTELPRVTQAPTFTPSSYPTPTKIPTPVNLPTQEGPLPPGLKMVYAETDGSSGITNIWLVNIANLFNERKLLSTINHKIGHGVRGDVSPDGKKISYVVPPPNAGSRSQFFGNELWIMNADGSEQRMIADQMGYLGMWSPDSKFMIAGRTIPTEETRYNLNPVWRHELYLVNIDSLDMQLLIADENEPLIDPEGWSSDGQYFYYVVYTDTSTELWAIDKSTKETHLHMTLPGDVINPPGLLPGGNWLFYSEDIDGQRNWVTLSIDGQRHIPIVENVTNSESSARISDYWSSVSQNILICKPDEANNQFIFEIFNLNTLEKRSYPIPVSLAEAGDFFTLEDWSSDEQWAVVSEHPSRLESDPYFIKIESGEMVTMPLTLPSNRWNTLGWMDQ